MAEPIRIVIIDDHALFRSGLRMLLESEGFEVLADVDATLTAPELVRRHLPDVVLLDTNPQNVDGFELLDKIVRVRKKVAVVVISRSQEDLDIYRAVRSGARGVLSRDTPLPQLAVALKEVVEGGSCLSPHAANRVMDFVRTGRVPQLSVSGMSDRELDVLRLLASGLENAEIGVQLGIKPKTVKNHVSHIFDKLGFENRVQAAVWALRNGFA
jgi:DNA-binding NarL/FixJ family response regulator